MKLALVLVFVLVPLLLTFEGCAGAKVSADLDVKVDPNACHEDPAHGAALTAKGSLTSDLVSLACTSLDGGVSLHVEFPRSAWHALVAQTEDGGAKSFPGK